MGELKTFTHQDPTREEIENYLEEQHIEVVVIVEGIEPTTSSTLQARHSYLIGGTDDSGMPLEPEDLDVQWDVQYADCSRLVPGDTGKGLVLDLSRFHQKVPAPP